MGRNCFRTIQCTIGTDEERGLLIVSTLGPSTCAEDYVDLYIQLRYVNVVEIFPTCDWGGPGEALPGTRNDSLLL